MAPGQEGPGVLGAPGVTGVFGVSGVTGGTTMATHAAPFQTCPVVQVMQVTPLEYELGGQVATQFPLKLILKPTHCPHGPPIRKK